MLVKSTPVNLQCERFGAYSSQLSSLHSENKILENKAISKYLISKLTKYCTKKL